MLGFPFTMRSLLFIFRVFRKLMRRVTPCPGVDERWANFAVSHKPLILLRGIPMESRHVWLNASCLSLILRHFYSILLLVNIRNENWEDHLDGEPLRR
jgi:hypothetical protein